MFLKVLENDYIVHLKLTLHVNCIGIKIFKLHKENKNKKY